MSARSRIIDDFLAQAGYKEARRVPLAGDASFRKYERIHAAGRQFVLMDAPPEKENVRPFMDVAEQLLACGLSAPRILAADVENGLLLLEDLGDDLFARSVQKQPGLEEELYLAAADVLVRMHERTPHLQLQHIPAYDPARFLQRVNVFGEWFLPQVMAPQESRARALEYSALWHDLLAQLPDLGRTLVLSDFHAENLIWLPRRSGPERVGLLDFQDAIVGPPAYDMVSFLEDARRDVAPQIVSRVLERYLSRTDLPRQEFMFAYALLGAQRNCRIVGTFARLAARDGKHQYLTYLPRVWSHLANGLQHPALESLKKWMDDAVTQEWRGAIRIDGAKAQAAG